MLDKIESALDKFNASAVEAKAVVDSTQNLALEAKELAPMLDLVDERIQKAAVNLKKEVLETIDQAHAKHKQEMEAQFIIERSHQKKMLLLNVGIATMAVITFVFQRILS
ncbi:hypothetical protein [Photobacterium sanguinicancri]|uniref:DUF1640 domain-containing protein n=1 Tax=Photobacterium sanguinicancri TaxID=875932 RepID=A0ABX4FWR7_9GAMM|nr:hypothetical protein [Photobacterium sanguinicancri]OZS43264.1 hypothetical protein ASV53_14090 [Photobacterium sanguinicancri]